MLRFTTVLAALAAFTSPVLAADAVPDAAKYQLDRSWPHLPIPNNWAFHSIGGIFADKDDTLWIHHSYKGVGGFITSNAKDGDQVRPGKCCIAAPAVVAIDKKGDVVHAWGGPGQGYDWPSDAHGVYVDYKGNVWIGGDTTRSRDGAPADGQILKFTQDGKFLMQIGSPGPSKGSLDSTRLSGPANFEVDAKTNEIYVADGYGNHRVIVFDADTGKFKRMWGAYGKPPTDDDIGRYDPAQPPAKQFRIVHCVRIANDGLVYVCDRLNDRIQVFKKDGTYVTEFILNKDTKGSGAVGSISFWLDAKQEVFVMNDPGNFKVRVVRRSDGTVLSSFGEFGSYAGELDRNHEVALDSHGNLYTSEDSRVQKFTLAK